MQPEFDPNLVVAEFLGAKFDKLFETVYTSVLGAKGAVRARMKRSYAAYLQNLLNRHSKAKSFFAPSQPVPFYEFFVPPDLSVRKTVLNRPTVRDLAKVARASIVIGTGGTGKSMFMRHMLVSSIREREKTPVPVELRSLNDDDRSLQDLIVDTLNVYGLKADLSFYKRALAAGEFCFLFDGFDELISSKRKRVGRDILRIAEKYSANRIIVSSRSDSTLSGWSNFSVAAIEPFDLGRAIELVEKLPFEDPIKGKFVSALEEGLFTKHHSFLSNPLLLSIMLLTYGDTAHIPDKLSIFYQSAYDSLFQKHDALKGGFQRERRSLLDIQDFAKAFAAFSLSSYDNREFSFSRSRALDLFDSARGITNLEFESAAILDDAIQAVCLLVEDGLQISFTHRSFQEFFTAKFVATAAPRIQGALIKRYEPTLHDDSTMQLLFEMNREAVEQHYLLPGIAKIADKIGLRRKVGITHYVKYLKYAYESFQIEPDSDGEPSLSATILDSPSLALRNFATKNYPLFWAPNSPKMYDVVKRAMVKEFGPVPAVQTKHLKTTSPFVRALAADGTGWSKRSLAMLFEVRDDIATRRRTSKSSLEAVLGKQVPDN